MYPKKVLFQLCTSQLREVWNIKFINLSWKKRTFNFRMHLALFNVKCKAFLETLHCRSPYLYCVFIMGSYSWISFPKKHVVCFILSLTPG